jgi:hypothetical protein
MVTGQSPVYPPEYGITTSLLTFRTTHKAIGLSCDEDERESRDQPTEPRKRLEGGGTVTARDSRKHLDLSSGDESFPGRLEVLADRVGALGYHPEFLEAPYGVLSDGGTHSGRPPAGEG